MRNPFRSEAAAFRLLLLTLVAGAAVAVAEAAGGTRPAVAVAALAAAVIAVACLRRGRPTRPLPSAPAHRGPRDERRALLLLDRLPDDSALPTIALHPDRLLVVSPVRTSRLHHWLSDVDGAREEARRNMDVIIARLRAAHIEADGTIGDEDPLRALDDALGSFGGDEIIAATDDDQLLARLCERYALPVTQA